MRKVIAIAIVTTLLTSCSIRNVVTRGEYIDDQSMKVGTPRSIVLARFGAPIQSTRNQEEDCIVEMYRVLQGEPTSGKVIKSGGILLLSILTYGLSEVVASPATTSQDYVVFVVKYKEDDLVSEYRILDY